MRPIVSLALFLLAAAAGRAESAFTLRAGAAHEDITPETTVRNWVTGKPYEVVVDPISVHALVLDDGRTKMVLVRWDLTDVSESARDEVRQAVGGALRIPGENIMINASHNHSAPWAPVYSGGYRGKERDTWWALRFMPAQNDYPPFQRWMARLLAATTKAAQDAAAAARPVTVSIGRITANEFVHNRRPRAPGWGLADPKSRPAIDKDKPERNFEVAVAGASFGALDRTLALITFRDIAGDKVVASLFQLTGHAVSIYPSNPGLSGDWPAPTANKIAAALGGEALFLQGCAGDINPWRRGAAAVAEMAEGIALKAQVAARYSAKLVAGPLHSGRTTLDLPLTPEAKKRLEADTVAAEVQVIACGPLAFVALPGETMTELGMAIRASSPFPQTLVMGYSNGNGVHYVGLPGEKARGGYEAGVAGAGTDECGTLLVEAAVKTLREVFARSGSGGPL